MIVDPHQLPAWLEHALGLFQADDFKDGDFLSHEWIKYALDIKPPQTVLQAEECQWTLLQRMDVFRNHLLSEFNIALQNVRGEGYRIVPPNEQAYVAAKESMSLIRKGLERGRKLLKHTRLDQLTAEEKKRHTDASVRMAGVSELMTRQRRDIFKLVGPKK